MRRFPCLSFVFLFAFAAAEVSAFTVRTGTITSDQMWGPDTQRITGTVTIDPGVTVTIVSGTEVKFDFLVSLDINGSLLADNVIFTSVNDDSVGEILPGSTGTPAAGDWEEVAVLPGGSASISNASFRFGGDTSFGRDALVFVDSGSLTLTTAAISDSESVGVRMVDAMPDLTAVQFTDNGAAALEMNVDSNPNIVSPTFVNNGINGLRVLGGTLSVDGFWDDPAVPYVLADQITVPGGVTLTVAAGQVIKPLFQVELVIQGTLDVQGTGGSPVIFTAIEDDTAGNDTNNDGAATSPLPGNWEEIGIFGTGSATLNFVELRYCGDTSFGFRACLYMDGGGLSISDSLIRDSESQGIRLVAASPVVSNVAFIDNAGRAMEMDVDSSPAVTAPSFTNNGLNGLEVLSGTLSADNFWDDPDIVYVLNDLVTVPAGVTLTVAAGQVIKPRFQAEMAVDGNLVVQGTSGNPVIFTALEDDAAGNDTNNDGAASSPLPGNWEEIGIYPGGFADLDFVEIRYGGDTSFGRRAGLYVEGATVTVDDSVIRDSESQGIKIVAANPQLTNVNFVDNNGNAVEMDVDSNPAISTPMFSNNAINGALILSGALSVDGFWDDPDVVYVMADSVTVPPGRTLTIGAGQVVKPRFQASLNVSGVIDIQGTQSAPVVFTAFEDDSRGGDTDNAVAAAAPGLWEEIRLLGGAIANIDFVEIHYGGDTSFGLNAGLYIESDTVIVNDSLVADSESHGVRIIDANPTISRLSVRNSPVSAIEMSVDANPGLTQISFVNNAVNGVEIMGGTLTADNTWGDPDVVYVLPADITVPVGLRLTIAAGQVLKPRQFFDLIVNGTLDILGTVDQPVIITSFADDTGGDTNNDGPSLPAPGQWDALNIDAGGVLNLFYAELRYGGDTAFSSAAIELTNAFADLNDLVVLDPEGSAVRADTMATADIDNCIFKGGQFGLRALGSVNASMNHCTVHGAGTAVVSDNSSVTVTNSIINQSTRAGLEAFGGGTVAVTYSDVFNPGASLGNFSGLPDPTGSNGNLGGDPRLINPDGLNFELASGSPAIDAADSAGAPQVDLKGRPRVDDAGVENTGVGPLNFADMGALERQDKSVVDLSAPAGINPGDLFGAGISVDHNTVVVGAPAANQVFVYRLEGDALVLEDTIDVPAGFTAAQFGAAVAVQGDSLVIGAPGQPAPPGNGRKVAANALAAALFRRLSPTSGWMLSGRIPRDDMSTNDDQFGASVAISGTSVLVGAPNDGVGDSGGRSGAAYLFDITNDTVVMEDKVKPPAPEVGQRFGAAVAIRRGKAAVGAPGSGLSGRPGSVDIFDALAGALDRVGGVTGSSSGSNAGFGTSVAVTGATVAVGAPGEASDTGAAYVFNSATLQQTQRLQPQNPVTGGRFGQAVASSGGRTAVGAPKEESGTVYQFERNGAILEQKRRVQSAGTEDFGMSVSVYEDRLAIGAPATASSAGAAALVRDEGLIYRDSYEFD